MDVEVSLKKIPTLQKMKPKDQKRWKKFLKRKIQ